MGNRDSFFHGDSDYTVRIQHMYEAIEQRSFTGMVPAGTAADRPATLTVPALASSILRLPVATFMAPKLSILEGIAVATVAAAPPGLKVKSSM